MLTAPCFRRSTQRFKVGRVETAVALLRHFERLAIPHMPGDTTIEVHRSMRRALRVGRRIQKHSLQAERLALVTQKHDMQLSTMPSADQQQCRTTLEVEIPNDEYSLSAKKAPICSPGHFHGSQEPVRMPSPVAPFCVDTSTQTFRSFLELIRGVRERKSPVPALPARTPASVEKADTSSSLNGKRTCEKHTVTVSIGPESSGEPTTNDAQVKPLNQQASKQQRAEPAALANGFAVASRSVTLEVLRGALKLLKVNLFHLVRVATMRRACRGDRINLSSPQIGGEIGSIESRAEVKDHHGSRLKQERAVDKQGSTNLMVGNLFRAQFSGSRRSSDGADIVGRDNRSTSPVSQGVTLEENGQKEYQGGSTSAEDVHGVIGQLYDELQTFLEEDLIKDDPETTEAALSVQVRSVAH